MSTKNRHHTTQSCTYAWENRKKKIRISSLQAIVLLRILQNNMANGFLTERAYRKIFINTAITAWIEYTIAKRT